MHRRLLALILIAAFTAPAMAQEREPAERQTLIDLAYALGESHALRQACAGEGDQYWRERMMQVTQTEAADAAFNGRLTQAFNSGFATRQTEFPSCSPASKRAELMVARKGQSLSRQLSTVTRVVRGVGPEGEAAPQSDTRDPDSMADDLAPR
ncbi:MAG: TIGR02301 family protein [Caulobacter sp.]|nr:TIGR02301 family protein [Caulobacter sp.]